MQPYDSNARHPRHIAQPDAPCKLLLTDLATGEQWEMQLADLSRQGLKAITGQPLAENTRLRVKAEIPTCVLAIADAAVVRWVRAQQDGRWAVGVVFDRELSWEVMGELFLSGILTLEEVPHSQTH